MTSDAQAAPDDLAQRRPVVRFYLDPSQDLPARQPSMRYLILTTPRTGSTWLAETLQLTGEAGVPGEYLHPAAMKAFLERVGGTTFNPGRFFAELEPRRTTANGSFGLKLLAGQTFNQIPQHHREGFGADLASRFDRVVYLYRRDKVAQAVSFYVAEQVAQFTARTAAEQADRRARQQQLSFRRPGLAKALSSVTNEEHFAAAVLAQYDGDYLAVAYEDLQADPLGEFARVFDYLGVAADPAQLDSPTKITRDETVEAQTEAFRAWLNGTG